MSDDFIPLNQSTPVQGKWQNRTNGNQQNSFQNNWPKKKQHHQRGHYQKNWRNNSQHSNSFGSDQNSSYGRENRSIDAYIHPAMLKDPWEHLKRVQKQ